MTRMFTAAAYTAGVVCLPLGLQAPAMADQPIVVEGANKYSDQDALKVVCKSGPKTGTRLAQRRCETKQDWAKIEEGAKRAAKEMFDKPMINTCRDGGC